MKALQHSDLFQSFGKKTAKKPSDHYLVVHHEDSPEQDFHPPSSRRHKSSEASSIRANSEDKKWAGGTFGKEGGKMFENLGIYDEDLSSRNLDASRNKSIIKESLNDISRRVLEKSRDKSMETCNLREIERFQRDCIYRDISNYGLKRYLGEEKYRQKINKLNGKNEKNSVKHLKRNGVHSERDTKRSEETKESYDSSGANHEKIWPNFRLSFERIPTINIYSQQGSSNRERSSIEHESSELEKAIVKLKEGQDNLKKNKRIKELERQIEEILGSVEIYSSQLAGYIEILRKDLLENNLYVLDLKDNIYALLAHNNKIIELVQSNAAFQNGNISLELGQEIERSRNVSSRVEADLDNIVDVVKINEECATRLAEFTTEKLTDVNFMNKIFLEGRGSFLKKDAQGSEESLVRMIKEIEGKRNRENVKDEGKLVEDIESLKEQLQELTKILEMKDKLIKRQNRQIKEMEELLLSNSKPENGQQSTQSIGLKNTAKKIIELQKKFEKGESEREILEAQIQKLLKGKDDLQKSLYEIQENNEQVKKIENELRESKIELRKMWDKNDALKELQEKNETLIATLSSLNSELKTEKQALLYRIKSLEDKETKINPISQHLLGVNSAIDTQTIEKANEDVQTSANSLGHKKYSFGNHLDDLFNKRISSIPNNSLISQNYDLLGQSWSDAKITEKSSEPMTQKNSPSIDSLLKWNDGHLAQSRSISNVSLPYNPDSEPLTNKILFGEKKDSFVDLKYTDTPRYSDILPRQNVE